MALQLSFIASVLLRVVAQALPWRLFYSFYLIINEKEKKEFGFWPSGVSRGMVHAPAGSSDAFAEWRCRLILSFLMIRTSWLALQLCFLLNYNLSLAPPYFPVTLLLQHNCLVAHWIFWQMGAFASRFLVSGQPYQTWGNRLQHRGSHLHLLRYVDSGLCKFSLLLPHALSCHNSAQLLVLFLSRYEPIDYDLLFSIVQDVKP